MTRTTTDLLDALRRFVRRAADETAEGVISTAIAVLILAFVGAGMYVGFQALSDSGCDAVGEQLSTEIGGDVNCDG